jgi:hypothetical protein
MLLVSETVLVSGGNSVTLMHKPSVLFGRWLISQKRDVKKKKEKKKSPNSVICSHSYVCFIIKHKYISKKQFTP